MSLPPTGKFTATSDQADRRLDRVLRGSFRDVPLGAIMKAMRNGDVRLNGRKTSGDARLAEGDVVTTPWALPPRKPARANPGSPQGLVTLYRDDDIWCADKPSGLLSQPDRPGGDSLITRAWSELEWNRIDFRPALISRLDRNVSGVETIAMNAPSLRALSEAMRSGLIRKIYIAVVSGDAPDDGEIAVPIVKDAARNFVRAARAGEKGAPALTRFRKLSGGPHFSALEVELVTGRPHQARFHLASMGHPIVGDPKYGHGAGRAGRLMLHAHRLYFPDMPELPGARGLEVVSPVPAVMRVNGDEAPGLERSRRFL
jgi:23S rRNA pseudouridine955/2504/2580 synthase